MKTGEMKRLHNVKSVDKHFKPISVIKKSASEGWGKNSQLMTD